MNVNNIKKLEWEDIKAIFKLISAFIPSRYVRYKKRPWLLCERKDNAQDNGWIFFNWLKQNHPERNFYFVLDENAPSYDPNDEKIIKWGSFKHYIYYMASKTFIKAMFNGPQPSGRMCNYYEQYIDHKQTAYLRHGIAKDGCEHHSYQNLKVRLFICGAKPEYDYFLENAGYPQGYLQYTGFARYDDLLNNQRDKNFILIMPTWRRYLCNSNLSKEDNENIFVNSLFFKHYTELLSNDELNHFFTENNLKVKFCLHAEFLRYWHLFDHTSPYIEFLGKDADIHQLLMETSLLITDYSSVFFDVAYMNKPIVFYHFDYQEFRNKHLSEGYFSYERDGFGPIATNIGELINCISECRMGERFIVPKKFEKRIDRFFLLRDNKNCQRIYNEIMKFAI